MHNAYRYAQQRTKIFSKKNHTKMFFVLPLKICFFSKFFKKEFTGLLMRDDPSGAPACQDFDHVTRRSSANPQRPECLLLSCTVRVPSLRLPNHLSSSSENITAHCNFVTFCQNSEHRSHAMCIRSRSAGTAFTMPSCRLPSKRDCARGAGDGLALAALRWHR